MYLNTIKTSVVITNINLKLVFNKPFSQSDEFWGRSIQAGQQTGQLSVHMQATQAK